jgi:hypothetical protein
MENSGKQNPKMGFKSPPEHDATYKWLTFNHLRYTTFYVNNVITKLLSLLRHPIFTFGRHNYENSQSKNLS